MKLAVLLFALSSLFAHDNFDTPEGGRVYTKPSLREALYERATDTLETTKRAVSTARRVAYYYGLPLCHVYLILNDTPMETKIISGLFLTRGMYLLYDRHWPQG